MKLFRDNGEYLGPVEYEKLFRFIERFGTDAILEYFGDYLLDMPEEDLKAKHSRFVELCLTNKISLQNSFADFLIYLKDEKRKSADYLKVLTYLQERGINYFAIENNPNLKKQPEFLHKMQAVSKCYSNGEIIYYNPVNKAKHMMDSYFYYYLIDILDCNWYLRCEKYTGERLSYLRNSLVAKSFFEDFSQLPTKVEMSKIEQPATLILANQNKLIMPYKK